MKLKHHDLDPYPEPQNKAPLYVNEPWMIDSSLSEYPRGTDGSEKAEDNIRVYIPLDISRQAVLRRLNWIIARYGETNENNEAEFSLEVNMLLNQVEIYDQIWYIRHMSEAGKHSCEAVALIREMKRQ